MKFFSGLMFLLALGMFANAISNRWAFEPTETGTKWVILDVVIGLLFAALSYFAYVSATRAEMIRSMGIAAIERQARQRAEELNTTQEPKDHLDGP